MTTIPIPLPVPTEAGERASIDTVPRDDVLAWPGQSLVDVIQNGPLGVVIDNALQTANERFRAYSDPRDFYETELADLQYFDGLPQFVYEPEGGKSKTELVYPFHFSGGIDQSLNTRLWWFRHLLDNAGVTDQDGDPLTVTGIATPAHGVDMGFTVVDIAKMAITRSMTPYADKIERGVKQRGASQVVFAGFSAGGQLSLETANRARSDLDVLSVGAASHPGNVDRYLVESVRTLVRSQGNTVQRTREGGLEALINLLPSGTDGERMTLRQKIDLIYRAVGSAPNVGVGRAISSMSSRRSLRDLLKAEVPVDVAYGTEDRVIGPRSYIETLGEVANQSSLELLMVKGKHCWGSNPSMLGGFVMHVLDRSPNITIPEPAG